MTAYHRHHMTCRVHLGERYLEGLSVVRWARAHPRESGVMDDGSSVKITMT